MRNTTRAAAVAGMFYPSEPVILRALVDKLLDGVTAAVAPPAKAIVAPHAGFIYSGPIAATAYAALRPWSEKIRRVVLLGPAHRVYCRGLALSTADYYETPLGSIAVDHSSCEALHHLPQVEVSDLPHAEEHSLEVHLPFLQTVFSDFQLLPIVVGEATTNEVAEALELLWDGDTTQIIISSDLSHYHDYATARKIDAETSVAIENLDAGALVPERACGYAPLRGLLSLAKSKGLSVTTLDLRNSGDTAGGKERVVGYGAYAVN